MRLKAALHGDLQVYMEKEYQSAAEAVTKGIRQATDGLKFSMRRQVKNAGLGSRLSNTWRGETYPKSKKSISAAGNVYSKAPQIMSGFEYQTVIHGKTGFWLAVPTDAIQKRICGKRITPALYEQSKNIQLSFVYRPYGPSFLVHRKKKISLIAFLLVPQVKMPKLINFETESKKWQEKLPSLILQNWRNNE